MCHPVVPKFVKILFSVRIICCLLYLGAIVGSFEINRWSVSLQINIVYWYLERGPKG